MDRELSPELVRQDTAQQASQSTNATRNIQSPQPSTSSAPDVVPSQSQVPPDNDGSQTQTSTQDISQSTSTGEIEKLLEQGWYRSRRIYKVKWKDKKVKSSWEYVEDIPSELVRQFHIHRTQKSTKRAK
mgnify:CR=1 FL=1